MNPGEKPSVFPAGLRREGVFVFICALVSVALIRSGFMSFFFLVPLGYAAAVCSPQSARKVLAAAIGLNLILSLGFCLLLKSPPGGQLLLALYYTLMALVFFWIMVPPERGFSILRVRTAFRFIGASLAGGLMFLLTAYILGGPGFGSLFRAQAELLSAFFIRSAGADAARYSFLEQYATPERIMAMMKLAALRGGAVVSALFLFFISRQAALFLAWISRRIRPGGASGGLRGFFAPPPAIWVLSLSLGTILVSRFLAIGPLETAAWNILILCVMLFLAQGGGIVLFTLSRRSMPPVMRLLLNLLILVLIFSPGINAFALGVLVLLGIAENWVPFRVPKSDESSSTPGI